jgi:hypothetical protein
MSVGGWIKRGALAVGTGGLSEGYRAYQGMKDDAAAGYNTAAAGARQAGQDAYKHGDQQWQQQMGGLQQALGGYGNASSTMNAMSSMGPGAGERYWERQQGQFAQPYQGSQNAAQAYGQNQGALGQQGAQEQFWGQQRGNTGPTASQNAYAGAMGQLQGPSRSEQWQPQFTNTAATNAGQMYNWATGGTDVDRVAGDVKGYTRGADDVTRYAQSQSQGLAGPGAFEQWSAADVNGTNPALARAQDKGMAALNQQMNRRGAFRSGAADVALGEMAGSFAAQDYENQARRVQDAQNMQLQRIGQGTQTFGASSQNKLAQGGQMLNLGNSQEGATANRMAMSQRATEGQIQNEMQQQELGLRAAGQADQSQLARLQGMGSLAGQSDNSQMQRWQLQQNAAQGADQGMLGRMGMGYQQAQGVDAMNLNQSQFGLQQTMAGGQLANAAQQAQWQRMMDVYGGQMGMANAQGGLIQGAYGQGGQLQSAMQMAGVNAMANGAQLQGQGQNASAMVPWQLAGLGMQFLPKPGGGR